LQGYRSGSLNEALLRQGNNMKRTGESET